MNRPNRRILLSHRAVLDPSTKLMTPPMGDNDKTGTYWYQCSNTFARSLDLPLGYVTLGAPFAHHA